VDLKLKDKKVLVTGASKGIGYATALAFTREGAEPVLVSRSEEALEAAERIRQETSVTVTMHGRLKTPQEVASLAVMLCSPEVHYLSGTVVDQDGDQQWR